MIFNEQLVLRIENTILQASNEVLTKGQKPARLTADVAAAASSITVNNYTEFADNDYLLIGNWGDPTAEITQINDASVDATITTGTLKYAHYVDTPITKIPYNQVKFYRATTLTGDKTILGSAVNIDAHNKFTTYHDITNSTGYGFFIFYNAETTGASEYSDGVSYEENSYNSIEKIIDDACSMAGVEIGDKHASEIELLRDANEAQELICKKQDWIFELVKNDTSIATTENENTYALSSLTYAMKYPNTMQGILNVRFGSDRLDYIDIDEMDEKFEDVHRTTLSSTASVAATSITLTDSYEFDESGSVYLGANGAVAYTANAESTGVLSGISSSAIDTEVASGASVWQGVSPGVPEYYSIFEGNIILDKPVETDEVGKKLKFRYLKKLTRFTAFSDTTEIPFHKALSYYIAYKIEKRRKNRQEMADNKTLFEEMVKTNMDIYKMPVLEEYSYRKFSWSESKEEYED